MELNFSYISKIGAFYIVGAFEPENEFRLLDKYGTDEYPSTHITSHLFDQDIQIYYLKYRLTMSSQPFASRRLLMEKTVRILIHLFS